MRIRKRAQVNWEENSRTIKYELGDIFLYALADFITWLAIIQSTRGMLNDVWNNLVVDKADTQLYFLATMIMVVGFEVIVHLIVFKLKRPIGNLVRIVLGLCGGMAIAYAGYTYYLENKSSLISGLNFVWGEYLKKYNYYFDDTYLIPAGNLENVSMLLSYMIIAFMVTSIVLTTLVKVKLHWIFLPFFVIFGEMLVGCYPNWTSLAFLFMAVLMLITFERPVGRLGVCMTKKRIGRIVLPIGLIQNLVAVLIMVAITGCVSLGLSKEAQKVMDNRGLVLEYHEKIEENAAFVTDYLLTKYLDDKRVPVNAQPPTYADTKIYEVTVLDKVASNIYQRNYIGADYQNGGWDYDGKEFTRACAAAGIDADDARSEIEGAIYNRLSDAIDKHIILNNSNPVYRRDYTIEYYYGDEISTYAPYYTDADIQGNELSEDVLLIRKLFTRRTELESLNKYKFNADEIEYLSTFSLDSSQDEIWNFYDEYVMNHYVSGSKAVPTAKEAGEWLIKPYTGETDADVNKWRLDMSERVAATLSVFDYSWEAYGPRDVDVVEYFLSKGHQGYCMHFATAATLILREMGVPARFASGYLINGSKFTKEADGLYHQEVYDRDAHAWVEVYLNHVGWVPVEYTQSFTIVDKNLTTGQEEKELRNKPSELIERQAGYYSNPWEAPILVGSAEVLESEKTAKNPQISSTPTAVLDTSEANKTPNQSENKEEKEAESDESDLGKTNVADQSEVPPKDEKSAQNINDKPGKQDETENNDDKQKIEKNDTSSPEDGIEATEAVKDSRGHENRAQVIKVAAIVLVSLAILVAGIALLKISLKRFAHDLENGYHKKDYSKTVRRINRRVYMEHRLTGRITKRYPTDAEYYEVLKKVHEEISAEDWEGYMKIVKEAKFAKNEVTADKAEFCYNLYEKIKIFKSKFWYN